MWEQSEARRQAAKRAAWRAREFERLAGECPGCGCIMHEGGPQDGALCTLDHHIPRAAGGPDEEWNWEVLCFDCNQAKGDVLPDDPRDR